MRRQLVFRFVSAWVGVLFLVAGGLPASASIVSFNFRSDSSSSPSTPMGPAETAGAPGVNAANWNDVLAQSGGTTLTAGNVVDQSGFVVPGMAFSVTEPASLGQFHGPVGDSNDTKMFISAFDIFSGSDPVNSVADMTVDITGIPYAEYDVYVYTRGSSTDRGGEVWVGDIGTGVRKSLRHLSGNHLTYVEVDDSDPFSSTGTPQGTFLAFRGLTGSSLTLNYDTHVRFPQSGIQIVNTTVIPEPSTYALLGAAALCMVPLTRRLRGRRGATQLRRPSRRGPLQQ